jgi:hypothetical protein
MSGAGLRADVRALFAAAEITANAIPKRLHG